VEHSQESPVPNTVWRKSTASGDDGNGCVEIALKPDLVLVRDSKHAPGPRLRFTPSAWTGFIGSLQ
jgi:hypothetical protein